MATMEYDGNIDFSQETPVAPVQLQPCPTCSRSFNPKALEKHAPICLKAMNGTRRRGKFDSTTQRVLPGTKATGSPSAKQDAPKKKEKPAWKVKHEQFVRNIRAARKAQAVIDAGGSLADLPPPPPDENPDYVKCPHCERRFNEDAAKRHMKFCEEQSKRNALKKKKNSNDPKALAASRRTQYKPPLPKQRTPAKSASTTTRTPTTRASARPLPVEEYVCIFCPFLPCVCVCVNSLVCYLRGCACINVYGISRSLQHNFHEAVVYRCQPSPPRRDHVSSIVVADLLNGTCMCVFCFI
eukprot:m.52465 g.52465  ORF g.52465 m.52465 type:complete len:297 (+) comp11303_c0_seq3:115-1005(+)